MSGAATPEEQKSFMENMEKYLISKNPSLAAIHPYGFTNGDGSTETKVVSEARWRAYQLLERWSFGVYATPEVAFVNYPEIFEPEENDPDPENYFTGGHKIEDRFSFLEWLRTKFHTL